MMYNDIVEECFFNPIHVGRIALTKPNTAYFGVNKKEVLLELYLEYTQERVIVKACFKARANPYGIAALEWLCRQIEGLSLDALPDFNYQQLIKVLDIPRDKVPTAVQVDMVFKELIKRCK